MLRVKRRASTPALDTAHPAGNATTHGLSSPVHDQQGLDSYRA